MLTYDGDIIFPKRVTEDTIVNSFGKNFINICTNTGMRICNGREHLTFYNHLGPVLSIRFLCTKILLIVFLICVFVILRIWSDHAPIAFTMNCLQFDNYQRTDNYVSYTTFRWDANNLEQMKCELNEKIGDFHKSIDKIQAAEMSVIEGLEYITSNLNTMFKPCCYMTFTVSNR